MGKTEEVMEETAKERIKRKKKERSQQLIEEPEAQIEDAPEKTSMLQHKREGVDVLEIYPFNSTKPKYLVQGNVKLKIHSVKLEVRNVPYSIDKKHKAKVQAPFRYHRFPDEAEKPDAYIESIKFDDGKIWMEVVEVVKAAVLEHHREELLKTEEPVKN